MDRFLAGETINIGTGLTVVAPGVGYRSLSTVKTYSMKGQTTSGVGSVTVQVQGSMDNIVWDVTLIGTITLTLGPATVSDGFTSTDRYKYVRMNVSALTGAGAAVTGTIGY